MNSTELRKKADDVRKRHAPVCREPTPPNEDISSFNSIDRDADGGWEQAGGMVVFIFVMFALLAFAGV